MRFVLVLLTGAVIALPAPSDCAVRRRVVVQKAAAVETIIQPSILATTFVPITYPAYGVSYVGGDYGELAKLRDDIKQLRDTLAQLAGPVPPQAGKNGESVSAPKEQDVTQRAIALVQNRCAQCHTEGKNPKGPGNSPFVIFTLDGKIQVTPVLLGAIYRGKTEDGKTMPPDGHGFTDEENAVIMDGLGRRKPAVIR